MNWPNDIEHIEQLYQSLVDLDEYHYFFFAYLCGQIFSILSSHPFIEHVCPRSVTNFFMQEKVTCGH